MEEAKKWPTLLGGTWVGSGTDDWFEDFDPADTRVPIALLPRLSTTQVADAIDQATTAGRMWSAVSAIDRGQVLLAAGQLLRERAEEDASDISRESGKLIGDARGEVHKCADFLEYYAGLGRGSQCEIHPDERPGTFTYAITEPWAWWR